MTTMAPKFSLQSYDIFSGAESDALWIECVDGLNAAINRMNAIATEIPGLYFVFGSRERKVLARTDTRVQRAAGA
jgi:hypothetical protein